MAKIRFCEIQFGDKKDYLELKEKILDAGYMFFNDDDYDLVFECIYLDIKEMMIYSSDKDHGWLGQRARYAYPDHWHAIRHYLRFRELRRYTDPLCLSIKMIRLARGLTNGQLAKLTGKPIAAIRYAQVDVSHRKSRYNSMVSFATFRRIADALNADIIMVPKNLGEAVVKRNYPRPKGAQKQYADSLKISENEGNEEFL